MALAVCPLDCEVCGDPECMVSGCRQADFAVLVACEACGELHLAIFELPICNPCWVRLEGGGRRRAKGG